MTIRQFSKLTGFSLKETVQALADTTGRNADYIYRYMLDRPLEDIDGSAGPLGELLRQRMEDCQKLLVNQVITEGLDVELETFAAMDGTRKSWVRFNGEKVPIGMLAWPVEVSFPLGYTDCVITLASTEEG